MFQRFRKSSRAARTPSPFASSPKGVPWLLLLVAAASLNSCANLPFVPQTKAPSRVFLTDFATAWTAALEAVSVNKDVVKSNNRETGIIETNWIDHSVQRHFLDVFKDEDFFLRMRHRMQIHVREGKKNDQQAVLVRVIKQQQRESTFLGGFQEVETDGLEESVLLYRIGRLIAIQQYTEEQDTQQRRIFDREEESIF
jgi:hypothetical protein